MPFVERNEAGAIISVSEHKNERCWEELESNNSQLQAFLLNIIKDKASMTESDLDFVRVVEDLVELLVSKNFIRYTDLPEEAQKKMHERKFLRGRMHSRLDLLSDDEEGLV